MISLATDDPRISIPINLQLLRPQIEGVLAFRVPAAGRSRAAHVVRYQRSGELQARKDADFLANFRQTLFGILTVLGRKICSLPVEPPFTSAKCIRAVPEQHVCALAGDRGCKGVLPIAIHPLR